MESTSSCLLGTSLYAPPTSLPLIIHPAKVESDGPFPNAHDRSLRAATPEVLYCQAFYRPTAFHTSPSTSIAFSATLPKNLPTPFSASPTTSWPLPRSIPPLPPPPFIPLPPMISLPRLNVDNTPFTGPFCASSSSRAARCDAVISEARGFCK